MDFWEQFSRMLGSIPPQAQPVQSFGQPQQQPDPRMQQLKEMLLKLAPAPKSAETQADEDRLNSGYGQAIMNGKITTDSGENPEPVGSLLNPKRGADPLEDILKGLQAELDRLQQTRRPTKQLIDQLHEAPEWIGQEQGRQLMDRYNTIMQNVPQS